VSPEIADRLTGLNIQILAEAKKHFLFAREMYVALVERTDEGFGSIGSTGVMTETGLAYLVWRGDRAVLVGKSGEHLADPQQVEAIRLFSNDLKSGLGL
jgi:hypothetical protein